MVKGELTNKLQAMCKRRTACSSTEAHQMILVPSPKGMSQIGAYVKNDSVMLQEFIQHDGVIVKVYVADGQISASTRPSFKNLDHSGGKLVFIVIYFYRLICFVDVVHFDSQMLPKSFETNVTLSDDLDKVFLRLDPDDIHIHKEAFLNNDKLQKIADSLHRQLVIIVMTIYMEK